MCKIQGRRDAAREKETFTQRFKELTQLLDKTAVTTGFGVNMLGCAMITVQDPLCFVAEAKNMVNANTELWAPRANNITYSVYDTLRRAGFRPVQRGLRLDVPKNEQLYYHSWIPHKDSASESGRAAESKKQRSDP